MLVSHSFGKISVCSYTEYSLQSRNSTQEQEIWLKWILCMYQVVRVFHKHPPIVEWDSHGAAAPGPAVFGERLP